MPLRVQPQEHLGNWAKKKKTLGGVKENHSHQHCHVPDKLDMHSNSPMLCPVQYANSESEHDSGEIGTVPTMELTFSESEPESEPESELDHGWELEDKHQEGNEGGGDEGDVEGYEDFNEPCYTPINGQNIAGNHHSLAITAQSQEVASMTSPVATQEDPSTSCGNDDCEHQAQVGAPEDEELPSPA
ncbi:hypothetical protein BS17DRAFT_766868 [Gyrodon lividus]|nr:hypothetical protein BS17DRAFT_766868 [Gyrodon lividus]